MTTGMIYIKRDAVGQDKLDKVNGKLRVMKQQAEDNRESSLVTEKALDDDPTLRQESMRISNKDAFMAI